MLLIQLILKCWTINIYIKISVKKLIILSIYVCNQYKFQSYYIF